MAKLSESDFRKEITGGEFKSLYLIYGEEKYLVKKYTDELVKKVVGKKGKEFDYFRFNSDADPGSIFDAAEQLPVLGDKKCVCVIDYDINGLSERDFKQFEEFLEDISPETVLVFSMPTTDPDTKKKSGGAKGGTNRFSKFAALADKNGCVIEFKKPGDIALERQLTAWCEKRGCTLTRINASKIIARVGTDMNTLKNEIEKLCAYADGKEIEEELIRLLCVKNTEAKMYALSDSISRNDFNSAYRQLHYLYEQNEKPEVILSVLSSAYVDMYRMKTAASAGKGIAEVAADFKYGRRDFILKNARNNAARYSGEAMSEIFEAILETDIKMKSTRADNRILLETLIGKLLTIVKKEGNV